MGLFSSSEAFLGIDIGASGIKLVEIHKTKNRPQLWTYGILDQPLDIHIESREKTPEELRQESQTGIETNQRQKGSSAPMHLDDPRIDTYAALLKQLLKQCKTTTRRVTASLPISYVFHSVLTLPYVEERKREAIVKAEVAKVVSRPVNEMQIVHQVLDSGEEKPKYLQVLISAAPKSVVAFYSAIFQRAGLQLEELETEAFALERSLVGLDRATTMVIDIGSERSNFSIVDKGVPVTHRSIQVGGEEIERIIGSITGMPEETSILKYGVSRLDPTQLDPQPFASVLNPIIKEVEYGFDLYLQQTGNEGKHPEKIILTGGSASFPLIRSALEAAFNVRVFVGDPWARLVYQQGLKPELVHIGPRMAVSIGLALRNIAQ